MADVIKQQPPVTEQLTQETLNKSGYKAGASFVKAITDKVQGLVKGMLSYNFGQRFKESGAVGIAGDAIKSLFRKPKQQPLVQETLEKADRSPPRQSLVQGTLEKADRSSPRQSLVQGPLEGIIPATNQTDVQKEDVPTSSAELRPEQPTAPKQLELPGFEKKEKKPKEEKLIKTDEKPSVVLIGGITEPGIKNLKEKLPEILKEVFKKLPKEEAKKEDLKTRFSEGGLLGMLPKGLLAMGGGLALLLGGLAALVTGLQTDGPFKGLLKIFSKVGLQGGLKLLEKGAKTFLKTLTSFIKAPIALLDEAGKGLMGLFSKGNIIGKTLKPAANILSKMLSGLVKILTPILKRIPLVGTIISWGFAYTRFKSGDTIGGIIDVLSGIATIFPGVGTAISIGLDILNAFLDFKTGGATKETSQKKSNILMGWVKGVGDWFAKNAENFPLIGPLIKTGRLISESKWAEALASVVEWIPGVSWVLDWLGFTAEKRTEAAQTGINKVTDAVSGFMTWINESVWGTISGFFTGIFDGVKSYWDNLSLDPRSWIGMAPEPPSSNKVDVLGNKKTTKETKPELKDGGVIPKDTTALVGEAGDEAIVPLAKGGVVATQPTTTPIESINESAVIPLEKYFNGKDFSLSNNTLSEIASNTGTANEVLKALSQAIFKLAQVYDTKSKTSASNIVINGQKQETFPSASQVAAANIDPIRRIRAQFAI